jgi:hypothetical protein
MSLLNTLLRLGIISSLADRQGFIEKTSRFIEQYYNDPEAAERLARVIATYMEDVKNNINMGNAVRSTLRRTDFATKEDIEELTKALNDLITEIREQKAKNPDDGIS